MPEPAAPRGTAPPAADRERAGPEEVRALEFVTVVTRVGEQPA